MKYKNGDKFTGSFRNGKIHEGLMNFGGNSGDDESYLGQWENSV